MRTKYSLSNSSFSFPKKNFFFCRPIFFSLFHFRCGFFYKLGFLTTYFDDFRFYALKCRVLRPFMLKLSPEMNNVSVIDIKRLDLSMLICKCLRCRSFTSRRHASCLVSSPRLGVSWHLAASPLDSPCCHRAVLASLSNNEPFSPRLTASQGKSRLQTSRVYFTHRKFNWLSLSFTLSQCLRVPSLS